jgi:TPR repeat protein
MKIKNLIIGLTLSLLMVVGVAITADFGKGLSAAQSGDFKTALSEWTPLAEQGHAESQNNLGIMYFEGAGVLTDNRLAYMWVNLSTYHSNDENGPQAKGIISKQMTPADISKAQDIPV